MSFDVCVRKCVGSKREGLHQGHKGRSRRDANKPEDNGKGMVKLKHKIDDFWKIIYRFSQA